MENLIFCAVLDVSQVSHGILLKFLELLFEETSYMLPLKCYLFILLVNEARTKD